MDKTLHSGNLEKFSMGRSIGVNPQNWKMRFFKLTTSHVMFLESCDEGGDIKFECPLSAISLLFCEPTKEQHSQAVGPGAESMFAVRLFDNGVYTLLMRAANREDKERWLQALKDAIAAKGVKGFQVVMKDGVAAAAAATADAAAGEI